MSIIQADICKSFSGGGAIIYFRTGKLSYSMVISECICGLDQFVLSAVSSLQSATKGSWACMQRMQLARCLHDHVRATTIRSLSVMSGTYAGCLVPCICSGMLLLAAYCMPCSEAHNSATVFFIMQTVFQTSLHSISLPPACAKRCAPAPLLGMFSEAA